MQILQFIPQGAMSDASFTDVMVFLFQAESQLTEPLFKIR